MCRLADVPAPAAAYGVDVASTTIAGREMYNTPNYAGPPEDRQPVSEVDVATLLRRWLGLIILVPLVMAGIAVAYSFSQPSVYKASAKVLVGQEQGQRGLPAKPDDLQLIAESAVEVFTLHPVAAEAARRREAAQINADAAGEERAAGGARRPSADSRVGGGVLHSPPRSRGSREATRRTPDQGGRYRGEPDRRAEPKRPGHPRDVGRGRRDGGRPD